MELGPNLLLEKTGQNRIHYRQQDMAAAMFDPAQRNFREPDFQWIANPEKKDRSHLRDHAILLGFFGARDGSIRQITLEGIPLGDKQAARTKLAEQLPARFKSLHEETGIEPKIRVAMLSFLDRKEIAEVVNGSMGRENNKTEIEKLEFCPMPKFAYDLVKKSPESRFNVRGEFAQDTWTGLIWQLDGSAVQKVNYYRAVELAGTIEFGPLNNWRVPAAEELATIFPATEEPFVNSDFQEERPGKARYWSFGEKNNRAAAYGWFARGGPNGCIADKNFCRVRYVHDPIDK